MKYELLKGSFKGVMIDRTPILQDMRETYHISFLLPDKGAYIALFTDANGIEYRKTIENGVCKCPIELFGKKEQFVQLVVSKIEDGKITENYLCEPLQITALLYMRQNQWVLSGGVTDKGFFDRHVELERRYSEVLTEVEGLRESLKQSESAMTEMFNNLKEERATMKQAAEIAEKERNETIMELKKQLDELSKKLTVHIEWAL